MNVMKFAIPALLAFSATFAQQGAPTGAAVDPTAEEQKALDALKGKLEGAIVWATSRANSHHDIWMMNADEWRQRGLVPAHFSRWIDGAL